MKKRYFVIIGDMVQSRTLENRHKVQQNFERALFKVQSAFVKSVVSPFTLTIGDEFQAVLKDTHEFFAMINLLENSLPDIRFRYGLGVGEIQTAINRKAAIGMDGPAFHFAREALEQARNEKRKFVLRCEPFFVQRRIDLLFHWIDVSTANWSKEKQMILRLTQNQLTQKEIARAIGISQPAVSQHVRQPIFKLVLQSQQVIQEELNALMGNKNE